MSKEEIFNYFYTNSANLDVKTILATMIAGFVVSLIVYITYWAVYKGVQYNSKFNNSLIILTLISTVVMLMISSNIVISLGMVGALSIIRFRTAIKDSRDTVFIFWAISEGLCVGSHNLELAFTTTLFIAVVFMFSNFLPTFTNRYLLILTGGKEVISIPKVKKIMKPFVIRCRLRVSNRNDFHQEMIFEIRTRGELDPTVIDRLMEVENVNSVNYVIESGEKVG